MNRAVLGCFLAIFFSGCSLDKYCDERLGLAWGTMTASRFDVNNEPKRPTADEADALRKLIQRCKDVRPQFDLIATIGPGEGGVWGSANVLLLAVELDDVSLLDQLISEGHAYDGLPNSFGVSTLYLATYRQANNAFTWALAKGVDPNLTDTEGVGPLLVAAAQSQGESRRVDVLIEAGAEIDAVSTDGWNPLAAAIRSRKFDNALLLVEAGADDALAESLVLEKARTAPNENAKTEILATLDAFAEYVEITASE